MSSLCVGMKASFKAIVQGSTFCQSKFKMSHTQNSEIIFSGATRREARYQAIHLSNETLIHHTINLSIHQSIHSPIHSSI